MIDVSVVSGGIAQAQSALLVVVGGLLAFTVGVFGVSKLNRFIEGKRIQDAEWADYCKDINSRPLAGDGMTTEEYMEQEATFNEQRRADAAVHSVVSRDYDAAVIENGRREADMLAEKWGLNTGSGGLSADQKEWETLKNHTEREKFYADRGIVDN